MRRPSELVAFGGGELVASISGGEREAGEGRRRLGRGEGRRLGRGVAGLGEEKAA